MEDADNKSLNETRPGQAGRLRAAEIRKFILGQLATSDYHQEIGRPAAKHFGVRRHVVHKQLQRLQSDGLIDGEGHTNSRRYRLARISVHTVALVVSGIDEDTVWREHVLPHLGDVSPAARAICQYGLTEMVNNVIDHSESSEFVVATERTASAVILKITDLGVGIFAKIRSAMNLPSLQEALFELTKGKFTTDPHRHTGEGVFFTSRAFDSFALVGNGLFLTHEREEDDWLVGAEDQLDRGTFVKMVIAADSKHTMEEVFEHYASERADYGFNKTNVILRLLDSGDDSFVSRSQAKRVLVRLPRFKEVTLDFEGVRSIGPAFADEIFRVFANSHPDVHLTVWRASELVQRMISRAQAARESGQAAPTEDSE